MNITNIEIDRTLPSHKTFTMDVGDTSIQGWRVVGFLQGKECFLSVWEFVAANSEWLFCDNGMCVLVGKPEARIAATWVYQPGDYDYLQNSHWRTEPKQGNAIPTIVVNKITEALTKEFPGDLCE